MATGVQWVHLGEELRQHRVRVLGYKNRTEFFRDKSVPQSLRRIIQDLERHARDNYDRDTLTRVEGVYELQRGAINRVLQHGGPLMTEDLTIVNELPAQGFNPADLRRRVHALVDALADDQLAGVRRHISEILAQEG